MRNSKPELKDVTTIEFTSKGRTVTTTPEGLRQAAKDLKKQIRTKQQFIPGTEPPTFHDVEEAADAFYEAKEDRDDAAIILDGCKFKLIEAMKKHEIRIYDRNGIRVEINTKDSAKVKKHQAEKKDKRRNVNVTE